MLSHAPVAGPLILLGLSIAVIVATIGFFRLHAFFALMFAATLVALAAAPEGPHRWAKALTGVTTAFGVTAGNMGLMLALAAVIGVSLMESGAADRIVRSLIAVCGERFAALALLLAGFFLCAPVFFDTVMLLLLPLARAMSLRIGRKNYLLFILATASGGIITNGTVPPAPGPLYVANQLGQNLALVVVAAVLVGIIPAAFALFGARWFDRVMPIEPRSTPGATLESLEKEAARPVSDLPSLPVAVAPVLIPVVLIAAASIVTLLHSPLPPRWAAIVEFLGTKEVALGIGAVIAVAVHARHKHVPWRKAGSLLGPPLELAALIILIIAAGSAYGNSIKHAGLDHAVRGLLGAHAINYVVLGWAMAAIMRGAQGSATVAMITSVGVVTSVAGRAGFGIHPLYVLLAIGYGSKALGWMNDAGFWLISRIGGLTQSETLCSWSILATGVSLVGFAEVWLVSTLWPWPHLGF